MTPYYENAGVQIFHGDCREILPSIAGIDLVVTDPPWGISYNPARSSRVVPGLHSAHNRRQFSEVMAGDGERFNPSHLLTFPKLVLWGANHYASRLPDSGGWMVWDKKRGGTVSAGFVGSHAELAWTNIGNTVKIFQHLWNGLCRDSEQTKHYHPTQKPVALMKWSIELNCGWKVDEPSYFRELKRLEKIRSEQPSNSL